MNGTVKGPVFLQLASLGGEVSVPSGMAGNSRQQDHQLQIERILEAWGVG